MSYFGPDSSSRLVLSYAKMKRIPVTPEGAKYMFPKRFHRPYLARRCFKRLETSGYVKFVGNDSWMATQKGIDYLYSSARPARGAHADR